MALSKQQSSTLEFFRKYAPQWRKDAEKEGGLNTILQRNGVVMRVAAGIGGVKDFLDVGCGTGELVFDMAETGASSIGVDMAPDMIALCREKKERLRSEKSKFFAQSIFDFTRPANSFDLISAQGLVEYINGSELEALLEQSRTWLRPGGLLVASIRNRLFNLLSLNDFSRMELVLGTTEALYHEAIAIAATETMADAIGAARSAGFDYAPPDEHPITGIPIKPRYQFTPGQMVRLFERHGLRAAGLYAVHYHAFLPSFGDRHRALHGTTSQHLYELACEDPRTIPASSTFILAAEKV